MNPIKILLVDDSKSARYALRLQLKHHDTEVDTADSAEAALERVRIAPPDAIFMDHTMPGMNGLEALERLKADSATAHIPVVMCTSNEEPEYFTQARGKGALDVLAKSAAKARLPALLEHVQEVLASAAPEPTAEVVQAATAPAMDADTVAKLIRHEAASEVERQLESAMESMTSGIEDRLERAQEQNVQAALMPLLTDFGEHLTAEVRAHIARSIGEQLQVESDRLQNQIVGIQDEQNKQSYAQVTNEVIPQAIAQQFAEERNKLAHMVQELIDHSLDNIAQDPKLMIRVQEVAETAATSAAEEITKNSAREIAEAVAKERTESVADSLATTSGSGNGTMYILAAVAALVGIASSVGVYLMLS